VGRSRGLRAARAARRGAARAAAGAAAPVAERARSSPSAAGALHRAAALADAAVQRGSLTVELGATPGITLGDSSRLGAIAEKLLLDIPEVAAIGRRTGRAELDEHAQGIETTELDVRLKPSDRPRDAIVRDIRQRLAVLPVALNIGQPVSHRIDHLLSGVRAEVVVKIFGPDLDTADAIAARLRDAMAAIPGLTDVQVERQAHSGSRAFGRCAARGAARRPPNAVSEGRNARQRQGGLGGGVAHRRGAAARRAHRTAGAGHLRSRPRQAGCRCG
jgi:HME family heavy-metal exporter